MHFHHKHDLDGCHDGHDDQPILATLLATLDRMEMNIMTAIQDSIAAGAAAVNELAAEVRDLKGQVATLTAAQAPAADTAALDAAVSAAADVLPAAPAAPEAPAPVEAPAAPADAAPADQAPVDQAPAVDPNAPAADGTVPANGIPSVPLA